LGHDFAAYTSGESSKRLIASLISKYTESEAMQTAAEAKVKLDSLKAAVKNSTASADLLKPINESIAQAEKKQRIR
jgi:hypothetical protein